MSKFFYLLKGTLYRSQDNPNDLIEINEVFENDNLIEARERVFEVYQNYIDVLLESKETTYESHNKVYKILNTFIEKEIDLEDLLENHKPAKFPQPDLVNDFDKGLSIFLISKDSKTFTTLEGEVIYEDKLLIHDLNSELPAVREHMYVALEKEYKIYKESGYDCKEYEVVLWSFSEPDKKQTILKTPIDYTLDCVLRFL